MSENEKEARYADFGRRLTELRKKSHLTQAMVAERLGVTTRAYVNYEKGLRLPPIDTAAPMAKLFGVSTDELLGTGVTTDELLQARVADELEKLFDGSKGAKVSEYAITATNSALAGGVLSPEDRASFIATMQIILASATLEASGKFTPYSKRDEEWSKKHEAQTEAVNDMVKMVRARADEELKEGGLRYDGAASDDVTSKDGVEASAETPTGTSENTDIK